MAAKRQMSAEPAIIADIERVRKSYPDAIPGGLQNDLDDHTDRYSGSQGYFHDNRYEPHWFVDAANGDITITNTYTTAILPITPAQYALVRKVCTGSPESDAEPTAP